MGSFFEFASGSIKRKIFNKSRNTKRIRTSINKKADKNILDKVIAIIEDMTTKDKEIEELLKKHHLKLV